MALLIAGCAGTSGKQVGDTGNAASGPSTVKVTVPQTVVVTQTVSPSPSPTPTPTTSSSLPALGSKAGYTYTDGLTVSVPFVSTFQPSRYSAGGHPGNVGVKVTVELKNDSTKIFDPTLASLSMSYGARGNQADEIYDSAHGIGNGFTTKLPPGRIASAVFAFSVPPADLNDLILQVAPDFEHDSELFQGSAN